MSLHQSRPDMLSKEVSNWETFEQFQFCFLHTHHTQTCMDHLSFFDTFKQITATYRMFQKDANTATANNKFGDCESFVQLVERGWRSFLFLNWSNFFFTHLLKKRKYWHDICRSSDQVVAVWSVHLISGKSVKHVSNVRFQMEKVGTLRSFKEGSHLAGLPIFNQKHSKTWNEKFEKG